MLFNPCTLLPSLEYNNALFVALRFAIFTVPRNIPLLAPTFTLPIFDILYICFLIKKLNI